MAATSADMNVVKESGEDVNDSAEEYDGHSQEEEEISRAVPGTSTETAPPTINNGTITICGIVINYVEGAEYPGFINLTGRTLRYKNRVWRSVYDDGREFVPNTVTMKWILENIKIETDDDDIEFTLV